MQSSPPRIRLTMLGGFLGAGKTTWLRHHVRSGVFRDAIVIADEARTASVDDALLSPGNRIRTLSGGGAGGDGGPELLRLLRDVLASSPVGEAVATQRLVLELSGLSDPSLVRESLASDPVLSTRVEVGEVVVIVDAINGLDLLRNEALAYEQVASADCLIISKTDAVDGPSVARLLEALRQLNPAAVAFGAIRGVETRLPDIELSEHSESDPTSDREVDRLLAAEIQLRDTTWPIVAVWLSALLHAHGDDVLRVKGIVRAPAGRLFIQAVRGAMQPPERLPEAFDERDGVLTVFARGDWAEGLQRSLDAFAKAAETSAVGGRRSKDSVAAPADAPS